MARKVMVQLYYTSKKACREDCDTLGIDRRRVCTRGRWGDAMSGFDGDGNPVFKPVVAVLRVNAQLVDEHLEQLQHDDDESFS